MAQLTETTSARTHPALRFLESALSTVRLLARHRLRLPKSHVGARLSFEDGTTSTVYRETVLNGATTRQPTVLVVRFQLRFIGRNPLLHKLFRLESLLNTPLFAGFPGFRTKLWLCDTVTGVYRGVYEWDGAARATEYAETLLHLLRLVSVRRTLDYHTEEGMCRDDFVQQPILLSSRLHPDGAEAWWRVRQWYPA